MNNILTSQVFTVTQTILLHFGYITFSSDNQSFAAGHLGRVILFTSAPLSSLRSFPSPFSGHYFCGDTILSLSGANM